MSADTDTAPGQPLDDVMLAMDVVDTLRRRERLVERELGDTDRREDLKRRLHDIYSAQGIEVPDRILEEGVRALGEDRFVFSPPQEGLGVRLARLYVSRWRWGKWLGAAVAVILVAWAYNYVTVTRPNAALGADIAAIHQAIGDITGDQAALDKAGEFFLAGETAFGSGKYDEARMALAALEDLRDTLSQAYTLRIVNEPGEYTAVWRIPDVNEGAKNYYAIVETLDAAGKPVTVPVTSEETGKVARVSRWGVRIDTATFDRIANDKMDDGIIQNNVFGRKERGEVEPVYLYPTTGAAITEW